MSVDEKLLAEIDEAENNLDALAKSTLEASESAYQSINRAKNIVLMRARYQGKPTRIIVATYPTDDGKIDILPLFVLINDNIANELTMYGSDEHPTRREEKVTVH